MDKLLQAQGGDIKVFQGLFVVFQDQLKSYLFRLTANRADAEDLAHDTFIRAFDKLDTFQGKSTLKTWVFQIATNLAYNKLKFNRRWTSDVSEQAKILVMTNGHVAQRLEHVHQHAVCGSYEIKEHIDTCFTCVSKNLPIEQQVALLLKDVYDFAVKEIMHIMQKSEGQVKYFIQGARKTMTTIFEKRCALVSKNGVCHQCSELNGWFNPKQDQQAAKLKLKLVQQAAQADQQALYRMRTLLVKSIDPLRSPGYALQEMLLNCNRMAMEELDEL